jgi:hypothetical protein
MFAPKGNNKPLRKTCLPSSRHYIIYACIKHYMVPHRYVQFLCFYVPVKNKFKLKRIQYCIYTMIATMFKNINVYGQRIGGNKQKR